MKLRKGSHDATGLTFGIVASKFNKFVTSRLLAGMCEGVDQGRSETTRPSRWCGCRARLKFHWWPASSHRCGRFDAVICLGAVIRGDTPHFEYISAEVSRGIMQASMEANVPVVFGVLTTETVAQAIERADPTKLNRGGDAAKSAVEMVNVMRLLGKEVSGETSASTATPPRRATRTAAGQKR